MATMYLSTYIGNYFPTLAALTAQSSHPGNKHTRSSTSLNQHHEQQRKHGESPKKRQQPQLPNYALFGQHLSVVNATSNTEQHASEADYYKAGMNSNPQTLHLTTPVPTFSTHIPSVMLARFEAFEDTSKFKCVDEYASEIDQFMREMEITTLPNVSAIDSIQTEVNWKHRKSLILWLIEVHSEYDLRPETLYLTINFIDRVCAKRFIKKSDYQLLGLTCLWIAAKYEENHGRVPSPKTLAMLLECSVPISRFASMEKEILSDLNFVLGHPTPEAFLKSQCKQLNNVKPSVRALARLIMELTLIHRRFRPFRPSLLAMASLILADSLYSCRVWTHCEPLLGRIIQNLEECLIQAPRQIIDKYRSGKFLTISSQVKTMLDSKAAYLFQSRISSNSQTSHNPNTGALTPPKDESPFRNPWNSDPNSSFIGPNSFPQHSSQMTPVYQHHQQYISRQPAPVTAFQLPPPRQYFQQPLQHQQYSGNSYSHVQLPQLYRVASNGNIYLQQQHQQFHPAFQLSERNYSEASSRLGMDLA